MKNAAMMKFFQKKKFSNLGKLYLRYMMHLSNQFKGCYINNIPFFVMKTFLFIIPFSIKQSYDIIRMELQVI